MGKSNERLEKERKRWRHGLLRRLIRAHASKHQRLPAGLLEKALWAVAKWSPFGGTAVPADFSNPYLLRTYLLPNDVHIQLPEWSRDGSGSARPYLHFFFRGDGDREFHNHPWRVSYSLILSGGYVEYKWNPETKKVARTVFGPGSVNVLKRDDYHRVELLDEKQGCWTLFVSIDRLHKSDGTDWGFLNINNGQYTPWGMYTGQVKEVMS